VPPEKKKPASKKTPLPEDIKILCNNQPGFRPVILKDQLGMPNLPTVNFSAENSDEWDDQIVEMIVEATNALEVYNDLAAGLTLMVSWLENGPYLAK
jgi:hypothetical protein